MSMLVSVLSGHCVARGNRDTMIDNAFIGRIAAASLTVVLGCGAFLTPAWSQDLLETVRSRGTLIVGTEARFPPFEFVEDGVIVGYSADVMAEVMKALPGVNLERLDLPWQ